MLAETNNTNISILAKAYAQFEVAQNWEPRKPCLEEEEEKVDLNRNFGHNEGSD